MVIQAIGVAPCQVSRLLPTSCICSYDCISRLLAIREDSLTSIILFSDYFTADFFPFGAGEGDTVGPRSVDEATMAVSLPVST